MCKVMDELDSNAQQLKLRQAAITSEVITTKKQVRFGENQEFVVERDITDDNKGAVWYSNNDFMRMKQEIGAMVQQRSMGADMLGKTEEESCFRGLEFLKNGIGPSRKQRRLKFTADVLLYYSLIKKKGSFSKNAIRNDQCSQQLGMFSAKLSQDAQKRAQNIASLDASEARRVYYELQFIYEKDGRDCKMFSQPATTSSEPRKCREETFSKSLASSYYESSSIVPMAVQDLFSYAISTAAVFLS